MKKIIGVLITIGAILSLFLLVYLMNNNIKIQAEIGEKQTELSSIQEAARIAEEARIAAEAAEAERIAQEIAAAEVAKAQSQESSSAVDQNYMTGYDWGYTDFMMGKGYDPETIPTDSNHAARNQSNFNQGYADGYAAAQNNSNPSCRYVGPVKEEELEYTCF